MYDHKLILEDQVLEMGMDVPDNTNADTAYGVRTGGQEGRLAVVVRAVEGFTQSEDDILTITWLDSSDNGVADAYAAPAVTAGVPSYVITATGGDIVYAAGQIVARILIPMQLDKWAKINIALDDASITDETIDVFVEYLAN